MKKIFTICLLLLLTITVNFSVAQTTITNPTGKTFNWTAPVAVTTPTTTNAPEGYYILRGTVSGTYTTQSAFISGTSTPTSVFTYTPGTIYYITVRAYNEAGLGPISNEIVVKVPLTVVVPGTPTGATCN